jgi:hypothetical protein
MATSLGVILRDANNSPLIAPMMEAANTFQTEVNFAGLDGATTQKIDTHLQLTIKNTICLK